jgi:hypothetical protein
MFCPVFAGRVLVQVCVRSCRCLLLLRIFFFKIFCYEVFVNQKSKNVLLYYYSRVCICFRLLLRREGDVFCDVGSGTGRLVFAAAAM